MFSENVPKRPRGRPPAFSEEELREAMSWGVDNYLYEPRRRPPTRRTQLNLAYRYRVARALAEVNKYRPEHADALARYFAPVNRRLSVLTELGRIEDPRLLLSAAIFVAAAERNTIDAVALVHSVRRAVKVIEKARSDAALPTEALHYYFEPFPKVGLLIELGLTEHPERLRAIALAVADEAPPEAEAVELIRRLRLRAAPTDEVTP